ncbi:MAG: BACON domain-containing protein [Blastocatellia bacterium]
MNDVVALGNDVYVCGGIEGAYNSASSSVVTSGIARWNGSSWSPLGGGASATGQGLSPNFTLPLGMAAVNTDLYVTGNFLAANNSETDHVAVSGIAKWNGSSWSALGSGLSASDSNYGTALAATATHLYVGGAFAYTGENITASFGRYQFPVSNCSVKIAPPQRTVPRQGASGHVNVNAQGNCSWTAVSNVPWITITSGGSGSGDGKVNYVVAANTSGSQRIGTITISGQIFTIRQL